MLYYYCSILILWIYEKVWDLWKQLPYSVIWKCISFIQYEKLKLLLTAVKYIVKLFTHECIFDLWKHMMWRECVWTVSGWFWQSTHTKWWGIWRRKTFEVYQTKQQYNFDVHDKFFKTLQLSFRTKHLWKYNTTQ